MLLTHCNVTHTVPLCNVMFLNVTHAVTSQSWNLSVTARAGRGARVLLRLPDGQNGADGRCLYRRWAGVTLMRTVQRHRSLSALKAPFKHLASPGATMHPAPLRWVLPAFSGQLRPPTRGPPGTGGGLSPCTDILGPLGSARPPLSGLPSQSGGRCSIITAGFLNHVGASTRL